jgi:hypothetical protein
MNSGRFHKKYYSDLKYSLFKNWNRGNALVPDGVKYMAQTRGLSSDNTQHQLSLLYVLQVPLSVFELNDIVKCYDVLRRFGVIILSSQHLNMLL